MKKKRSDIFEAVINQLKTGSYNILQISDKTSINWETVKNTLETLEKIGLVVKDNNKYTVSNLLPIGGNDNTLLGIPISKQQEEKTLSLAKRISTLWDKKVNSPIKKTFLQKILVKIVKKENIKDIPYGWYLFGQCTLLQMDTIFDNNIKEDTNYDNELIDIINDYSKLKYTDDLLKKHYLEENNELYLIRLKISNVLKYKFAEPSIDMLKLSLNNFLLSFHIHEDNESLVEYINGFASIVYRLIKELSIDELEDIRMDIDSTFTSIWHLIGSYNFYNSMGDFFEKENIKKYYEFRISSLKQISQNYIHSLIDKLPQKEFKEDKLSRFKGIQAK